jgi:thiol-disulfide isomerase/thioredoxin
VLLDFWATWCAPCVAELASLRKLHADHAVAGLEVVSVSFDRDARTASDFVAKQNQPWTQIWAERADKGPLAELFGVSAIPATFLISPNGKVIDRDIRGESLTQAVNREMQKLRTKK